MSVEDSWYTIDKATGKKVAAKRHGRGKRWRVRNRGARTVSFDKRSDADAHDTAVKADLLKGITPFDHTAGKITYEEYATQWLAEHHYTGRSRETVRSRIKTHLVPSFGPKQMRELRLPSTHRAWLAELRTKPSKRTGRPLSASTVARIYDAHAGIIASATDDGILPANPLKGVEYPAVPKRRRVLKVWEQDTVNTLLAGVPDRDHAVPLLAASCGHRQNEALAVATEDIDFLKRREITVAHQVAWVEGRLSLVPPKGGKVRTVPLPAVTSQALAAHLQRYDTLSVPCTCHPGHVWHVLFGRKGRLVNQSRWNEQSWHPAVTAAGMTPSRSTGLHQLRHFYASTLIDGGASPKQVQEYLGHASITITMDIYGHLFERSADKARSIIDAAFTTQQLSPSAVSARR